MSGKINILVIDDDIDIGQMLKMMLEFKGYHVTLVNRVEKIMEALGTSAYHLLILDMLIAGENGNDICKELKKNEQYSAIPILMFSAMPDGRDIALQSGADDFIAKPFDMNAMIEKINSMIKKAGEATFTPFQKV